MGTQGNNSTGARLLPPSTGLDTAMPPGGGLCSIVVLKERQRATTLHCPVVQQLQAKDGCTTVYPNYVQRPGHLIERVLLHHALRLAVSLATPTYLDMCVLSC